ncbi:MAG: hypothetical protein MI748_11160 [Opitutales bacterium]|nr:hypothetical protein [Opitutales bacterium]
MNFQVKRAATSKDYERILFFQNSNRMGSALIHPADKMQDASNLDHWICSRWFYSEQEERMTSVLRVETSIRAARDFGIVEDLEVFGPDFPNRTTFTTEFYTNSFQDESRTFVRLLAEVFPSLKSQGKKLDFTVAKEGRRAFFESLGYRQCLSHIPLSRDQKGIPMVFDFDDIEYLEWIGSPLTKILEAVGCSMGEQISA